MASQPGATHVIVLEGINDIGIGKGSFNDIHFEERERVRQDVNRWIRGSGQFDAVIDFELTVRDKSDPGRMAAAYDSGDNLHPCDADYAAMADAIDLKFFAKAR